MRVMDAKKIIIGLCDSPQTVLCFVVCMQSVVRPESSAHTSYTQRQAANRHSWRPDGAQISAGAAHFLLEAKTESEKRKRFASILFYKVVTL